jgi:serine kinase of HPr protein (carbohydrate metabolism regulator)
MTQPLKTQIHASCIELAGTGVLLRGASGSGKSDFALRLIDAGARLVADDRTDLIVEGGRLVASAPTPIAGKLEVRGVGIVTVSHVSHSPIGLAVDLVATDAVERLPEAHHCNYLGIDVPLIALAPFECSAPAKLRVAVRAAALGRLAAA